MKRWLASALILVLPVYASAADTPASEQRKEKTVTITTDLFQPIYGIALLSGELAVSRRFSVGAFGGGGAVRRDDIWGHTAFFGKCGRMAWCEHNTVVMGGASALFYVFGGFSAPHSWQLGAEMSVAHEWGERRPSGYAVEVARELFGAEPAATRTNRMIYTPAIATGYKLVVRGGLTLNIMSAIGYRLGDEPRPLGTRLMVNAGWTF